MASRQIRDLTRFLILLILFSSVFYALLLISPSVRKNWMSYSPAFMWCPGVAALLTQWRDLGWRRGPLRYYAFAYLFPLAFCIPVYASVWLTGLGGFEAPKNPLFIIGAFVLGPLGMTATLGEELGWRGFLLPRLLSATTPFRATLIVGAIWALWHWPVQFAVLPIFLPNLPFWYATACFTVSVIAISFVYTWLWIRTNSVWPAALLHAMSNAAQAAFELMTDHTELTSYFTYEFGLGFAVVLPLLAFLFFRRAAVPAAVPPALR